MAASTLDQVIASLQGVYQPQLDSIAQQQAALPAQYAAQTSGVNAAKDDAFNGILSQARQRGTGVAFGGIPLGEQAQYTASTYAPALANLQTSQNQQSQSLIDSINKINEDKFNTANNLYQFGVNQDNQTAQLAEQQREFDAQQAAAAKAAASFNPTTGSPTTSQGQNDVPNLTGGKSKNQAATAIAGLIKSDPNVIFKTIAAIYDSAVNHGNTYDQAKLELLKAYEPAYFDKTGKPASALGNSSPGLISGLSGPLKVPGLSF